MDSFGAIKMKNLVTYDRANRNSSPKPEYSRMTSVPKKKGDRRNEEAAPDADLKLVVKAPEKARTENAQAGSIH